MSGGTHIQLSIRISWTVIGVLLIALSVPVDGLPGTALAIVGGAAVIAGYRRYRRNRAAQAARRG
jgi:hypothetical protein